jgi:hypothetical protein
MTWFDDGDGWRDDSTEGPIDTLKVHFASNGALEIVRYLPPRDNDDYSIQYKGKEIKRQESVALAKAWAEQWWKEKRSAARRHRERDTQDR